VRDTWSTAFAKQGSITLRGPVDKLGLFRPLFAYADEIAEQGAAKSDASAVIRSALQEMGVPQ
jgi:hypothetical protein